MEHKLLLVKCATLLYRESLLGTSADSSADLVRTVLESVKPGEVIIGVNKERETILNLKKSLLEMCENPPDHIYETADLLAHIRQNIQEDDSLFASFQQSISTEMVDAALKRTILNLRKQLHDHFRDEKVDEILNRASMKFRRDRDSIRNVQNWITELVGSLEPFQVSANVKDPAIVDEVDIEDAAAVHRIYESIRQQDSGTATLRTGWQGVNRAIGGGFRYGEEWILNALQHNYKTGFSLTLFKQIALYNTPQVREPGKKPLLLRISFEDPLSLNFRYLYKNLKENETGVVLTKEELNEISSDEMQAYVTKELSVNGWSIKFLHINPSAWTLQHLSNKIIALEAEGYELHVCMVDYLLKMPTTGCDKGAQGEDLRNLFERAKNFLCATKKALFITPHQLSTDAKNLIREERANFVQQLPGKGFTAGSKQLDQVVDGELFFHIEKLNREAYLTIQLGKLRRVEQVDDEEKYLVLKFVKRGIIPDDLGKPDTTRRKVGGDPVGGKEENPFWDLTGTPQY